MRRTQNRRDPHDYTMSLGDHLDELRVRLIRALFGLAIGLTVCISLGTFIIRFIQMPYVRAMGEDARLQSIAPAEGFISYMGITMIAGAVVSSPWIFYQLWQFVAAGLYPKERRYIYYAVPFSTVLFVGGALFFIFVIAPVTLRVLVLFNRNVLGVTSNFTFTNYVSFVGVMMLVFGLAFQTPIAIFFLHKTGIVSVERLRRSRKFVVLGTIVASSIATPGGDMFSLFALAIPIYLLFEFGILLSWFSDRRQAAGKLPVPTDSAGGGSPPDADAH